MEGPLSGPIDRAVLHDETYIVKRGHVARGIAFCGDHVGENIAECGLPGAS
jgi:hypothetical protein